MDCSTQMLLFIKTIKLKIDFSTFFTKIYIFRTKKRRKISIIIIIIVRLLLQMLYKDLHIIAQ